MDSVFGFLAGIFFRGQNQLLYKLLLFSDLQFGRKGGGGGGQKSLHLSRGLLRNRTNVKLHNVVSTMTSIAEEVTQTYSKPASSSGK